MLTKPDLTAQPAELFRQDRLRNAVRAVAELRRGAAVVVRDGRDALVVAAAETADAAALRDVHGWSDGSLLRLCPGRDGRGVVAASPADGWAMTPDVWRRMADPTLQPLPNSLSAVAAPHAAAAAIDLAKLTRLLPVLMATAIAADGLARARASGAVVVEAEEIAALRASRAHLVRVGEARVPLEDAADARLVAFRNPESGEEHVAVVIGHPEATDPARPAPLVRLHSECFTGDVLGSLRCDCGPQLRAAIRRMAEEGAGVVLYLAQEGRGIGLLNKLRSYVLQDRGLDTVDANAALGWEADERDFAVAGTMLRDLGLTRVRLLTNNPAKVAALTASGLIVERASLLIAPNGVNDLYLATKAARFGHLLG